MHPDFVCILSTGSATPSVGGRLELAALKPLWQLYTTMMKDFGKDGERERSLEMTGMHSIADKRSKNNNLLAPEIIRALTELFLTVENLAQVHILRAGRVGWGLEPWWAGFSILFSSRNGVCLRT